MPCCFLLFVVVLVEPFVVDTLELAPWKQSEQLPSDIERLLDRAVSIVSLADVFLFEFIRELCVLQVDLSKSSLAEDRHQFLRVFSAGICCEQLVHRVRVVASRLSFADTLILKS